MNIGIKVFIANKQDSNPFCLFEITVMHVFMTKKRGLDKSNPLLRSGRIRPVSPNGEMIGTSFNLDCLINYWEI